jgi:hypothetical protein
MDPDVLATAVGPVVEAQGVAHYVGGSLASLAALRSKP